MLSVEENLTPLVLRFPHVDAPSFPQTMQKEPCIVGADAELTQLPRYL